MTYTIDLASSKLLNELERRLQTGEDLGILPEAINCVVELEKQYKQAVINDEAWKLTSENLFERLNLAVKTLHYLLDLSRLDPSGLFKNVITEALDKILERSDDKKTH